MALRLWELVERKERGRPLAVTKEGLKALRRKSLPRRRRPSLGDARDVLRVIREYARKQRTLDAIELLAHYCLEHGFDKQGLKEAASALRSAYRLGFVSGHSSRGYNALNAGLVADVKKLLESSKTPLSYSRVCEKLGLEKSAGTQRGVNAAFTILEAAGVAEELGVDAIASKQGGNEKLFKHANKSVSWQWLARRITRAAVLHELHESNRRLSITELGNARKVTRLLKNPRADLGCSLNQLIRAGFVVEWSCEKKAVGEYELTAPARRLVAVSVKKDFLHPGLLRGIKETTLPEVTTALRRRISSIERRARVAKALFESSMSRKTAAQATREKRAYVWSIHDAVKQGKRITNATSTEIKQRKKHFADASLAEWLAKNPRLLKPARK